MSRLGRRLVAATTASVLFVGGTFAISRARTDTAPDPTAAETPAADPSGPGAGTEPDARRASPSAGPDTDAALALLSDVEAAASATADDLLEAGRVTAQGPWRTLTDPATWPVREERPVYVGTATIEDRRRVVADLVIAQRLAEAADELVLRLLPAADALAENGLEVSVEVDGEPVEAVPDPGALLVVPLPDGRGSGTAVSVRVRLRYDLLTVGQVPVDGGPAAFGIHGRADDQAVLGHWLPVLTFEPEPLVPWGDLGSFPPAIWSVQIHHDATAVTGGAETDCPDDAEPVVASADVCVWARGVALRDLAAVVHVVANEHVQEVRGLRIRTTAGASLPEAAVRTTTDEAAGSVVALTDRFGALAWPDLEVVAVPLGRGAAGMEFPGLILVDADSATSLEGGFGTYVLAHEVGHQWFHALLGNGSFADPVVDESLAQYAAVLVYRDLFGDRAAQALVEQTMSDRYEAFVEGIRSEQPPAQPSADFASAASYGPLIYARGALAWIAAEEVVGPAAVEQLVRRLVQDRGLREVTADDVIQRAVEVDERFGQVLSLYWESPDPVPAP